MFAPEGYTDFSTMAEFIGDWAYRIYLAHIIEEKGRDPKKVFLQEDDAHSMLLQVRINDLRKANPNFKTTPDDKDWAAHLALSRDDDFFSSIIFYCLLSRSLLSLDTLLASPSGATMQPSESIFLHMDRLDWVSTRWPIRKTTELRTIFEYYDQGKFGGRALSERFCFVDCELGTIRKKNNSVSGFQRCSHMFDKSNANNFIKQHVDPFISWALVWNEEQLPDDYAVFLENFGFLPSNWEIPEVLESATSASRPTAKRGAKPTGAKGEFLRLYPDGKPENLSADAIAAQLTEAGFPISGRQVSNYAKEVKDN